MVEVAEEPEDGSSASTACSSRKAQQADVESVESGSSSDEDGRLPYGLRNCSPEERAALTMLAELQSLKSSLLKLHEARSAAHAELRAFNGEVTVPPAPQGAAPDYDEKWSAAGGAEGWRAKHTGRMAEAVPHSIADALESGDVALIRGSWLLDHAHTGKPLPRRQDLPKGALWESTDLFVRQPAGQREQEKLAAEPGIAHEGGWLRALGTRGVELVALSYCWATPEHPDPDAEQLQLLLRAVYLHMANIHDDLRKDMALFIDWCSLYQEPRTASEEASYQRALKCSSLWYAHQGITLWILPTLPQSDPLMQRNYHERAWPCFERALSELIKGPESVLDLSTIRARGGSRGPVHQNRQDPGSLWRRPPMNPKLFRQVLLRKKLTKESDRRLLIELYTQTFAEVMGGIDSLSYVDLDWEDGQVEQLSVAMAWCRKLTSLTIKCNGFEDLTSLAEALPSLPCLRKLQLSENHINDVGPLGLALKNDASLECLHLDGNVIQNVTELAKGLSENKTLRTLGLEDNRLLNVSALGDMLATNTGLQRLALEQNKIGDTSLVALAKGLEKNSTLLTLRLGKNHLEDVAPLGEALRNNTTLTELQLSENIITNVAPLFLALEHGCALKSLHLKGNGIMDISCVASPLAAEIALTDLMLDDNPISDWSPLKEGLLANKSMRCVSVGVRNGSSVRNLLGKEVTSKLHVV